MLTPFDSLDGLLLGTEIRYGIFYSKSIKKITHTHILGGGGKGEEETRNTTFYVKFSWIDYFCEFFVNFRLRMR